MKGTTETTPERFNLVFSIYVCKFFELQVSRHNNMKFLFLLKSFMAHCGIEGENGLQIDFVRVFYSYLTAFLLKEV